MDLDGGVAIRIASPGLESIRDRLANEFHGLLTAQDLGRWVPHVTIQNKVESKVARALSRELSAQMEPRAVKIAGLSLVRYADGPWEPIASYRFSGIR